MKKEILFCNRCGKQAKRSSDLASLFVCTGRSMDPSGNGYEDDGGYIDACVACLHSWLVKDLKDCGCDKAKKFFDFMNSK